MKGGGASRASPLFSVRDTHQFPRQGPARELPLVSAKTRQLRPLARPPQPAAYVADGRCTCSSTIGRERALRLRSALLLSRPTRKDLERNQPLVWVQLANPWQWHPLTPDYGPDHATAGHHQVTRADDDLCVPRAELRANCTGSQTTTKPPMFCQHGWEDERATAGSAAAVVMHTPAMHAAAPRPIAPIPTITLYPSGTQGATRGRRPGLSRPEGALSRFRQRSDSSALRHERSD